MTFSFFLFEKKVFRFVLETWHLWIFVYEYAFYHFITKAFLYRSVKKKNLHYAFKTLPVIYFSLFVITPSQSSKFRFEKKVLIVKI